MKALILLIQLLLAGTSAALGQQIISRTLKLMGSRFDITVVAADEARGQHYIDLAVGEISRIEKLISSWDPTSQTSMINAQAGKTPVKVDEELFDLIERSLAISRVTDGAFDISYAAMDRIWKFDGSMRAMPNPEEVAASVSKVDYRHIVLDHEAGTVFLEKEGMKIGFGAIGKGYAADRAKEFLMKKGVSSGIVNASGDMNTWGRQPDGSQWTVAITNPMDRSRAYGTFPISDRAVVTSGDYEKYVTFNKARYSHIIDPRTGYPATGIISVTVFAPSAELADALATSVFVMGVEAGIDRIEQMPGIECLVVDDQGELHYSSNIMIQKL